MTVLTAPKPVLEPGAEITDFASFHEPSVVLFTDESFVRHWVMAAAVSRGGPARELAIFRSEDPESGWLPQRSDYAHQIANVSVRPDAMPMGRFDDESISSPSLLVHNGAWHLYYTGREGPRSGIGLFLSDELLGWRTLSTVSAIFGAGRDAWNDVGVLDGDVVAEGSFVEMVYGGYDGARVTPGRVGRLATDAGAAP
jgi:hypothetical protein